MSEISANIGLYMPDLSDPADITKFNENWNKIDYYIATLQEKTPSYGTEDLIAGESQLETGTLYFVYE